jgi:hypothetical protein
MRVRAHSIQNQRRNFFMLGDYPPETEGPPKIAPAALSRNSPAFRLSQSSRLAVCEGAPTRLFGEKGIRRLFQERLLILKTQAAQLTARTDAPAPGGGQCVKALFLARSHG